MRMMCLELGASVVIITGFPKNQDSLFLEVLNGEENKNEAFIGCTGGALLCGNSHIKVLLRGTCLFVPDGN